MFSFTVTPRTDFFASGGERFLQSPFWAAFKSRHGWKSLFFDVRTEGCETFTVSVLVRRFGKFFSIAYIPMMPFFSKEANVAFGEKDDAESFAFDECGEDGGSVEAGENADVVSYAYFLSEFSEALKPFLPKHTLCIRFDPAIDFYSLASRDLFVASLRKAAASEKLSIVKTKTDIQPPDTALIDLTKSENELLGAMRSKWRYNIRLAEKKGVVVRAYRADASGYDFGIRSGDSTGGLSDDSEKNRAVDVFYELYKTTAMRDGIAIHAKKYYEDLFALSARYKGSPLVTVYVASHEGEDLASIITLFSENEAVYLYGASSNSKRNLMPAYLLQWTAICDAKAYGSSVYDFYGMPPSDDKNHPMYGLYLFKTGFGGRIVHRPGSIDAPLSAFYAPYALAESARAFYHKRIKKLFAGRAL